MYEISANIYTFTCIDFRHNFSRNLTNTLIFHHILYNRTILDIYGSNPLTPKQIVLLRPSYTTVKNWYKDQRLST